MVYLWLVFIFLILKGFLVKFTSECFLLKLWMKILNFTFILNCVSEVFEKIITIWWNKIYRKFFEWLLLKLLKKKKKNFMMSVTTFWVWWSFSNKIITVSVKQSLNDENLIDKVKLWLFSPPKQRSRNSNFVYLMIVQDNDF